MPYNLSSPNGIAAPCELSDLGSWFERELEQVSGAVERTVLRTVAEDIDSFVNGAAHAILLWPGCDRVPSPGKKHKYFSYPPHIKTMSRSKGVILDTRQNGPAIASYQLADGHRPQRFGSSNAWSIHHLYSGKFPYRDRKQTTHAVRDGKHFTQSAGLVAAHPVADALVDEFPFFAWLVRAQAFKRFGYDPDGVFSSARDEYGFVEGRGCRIIGADA